ncbi:hypothetical protein [Streptomyces sp. NPDC060205]|uniref:hypothetical protein n=1 Tax=Streptomyces sp. NPDC060205 TaxID=3347072 RepID=UPI003662FC8F
MDRTSGDCPMTAWQLTEPEYLNRPMALALETLMTAQLPLSGPQLSTKSGLGVSRLNPALLTAGFVDPAADLGLAFARTAGHWRAGDRDHRSDSILPTKSLSWRVQSYTVIDTPRARGAADHLPVAAYLRRTS